ncbi:MAG: hypothetical protein KGO49_07065 [Gammaproteobacteria bacterium]|nr:hypothetical protein [Gammaproteobacteria bacterium]
MAKLGESLSFIASLESEEYNKMLSDFASAVETETERGAVLNIVSFIDERLIALLNGFFPNKLKTKALIEQLDGSPLSTLMYRAKIANVLYLITDNEYEAIKIMAMIRNEFAHNWGTAWSNSELTDNFKKAIKKLLTLSYAEELKKMYRGEIEGSNKGWFFYISSKVISDLLARQSYAENLGKRLPEKYISIFDLPIEERKRIIMAEQSRRQAQNP